ncbi:MAG: single-stranded DNA-binding protein [Defluviitoga tunisiensis]
MSISFNKVIMVGRTTRVPEVKMTAGMEKVVDFTLAVDDGYGENHKTYFFDCVVFGKLADTISRYVGKGQLILVEGRISIDKWTDRNGVNREKPKILVNNFRFLETKKSQEENLNVESQKEYTKESEILDEEFEKLLNEEFPNE